MKSKFFIPWKEDKSQMDFCEKKIYTPKMEYEFLLDTDGIRQVNPPFFSIQSGKGTIGLFLAAVQRDAEEEAKSYISRSLWHAVDMTELRGLFGDIKEYQCFLGERKKGIHTLHLTIHKESGKTNVIAFALVEGKNAFGQWKIFQIEKE